MNTSVVAGAPRVAQPDSALGECCFFVGDGAVGVEVEAGFLNQRVASTWLILVGVAEMSRSANPTASRDEVVGLAGDLPGSPYRHPPGADVVPQAGQAVGQLQGVGDQLPPGVRG